MPTTRPSEAPASRLERHAVDDPAGEQSSRRSRARRRPARRRRRGRRAGRRPYSAALPKARGPAPARAPRRRPAHPVPDRCRTTSSDSTSIKSREARPRAPRRGRRHNVHAGSFSAPDRLAAPGRPSRGHFSVTRLDHRVVHADLAGPTRGGSRAAICRWRPGRSSSRGRTPARRSRGSRSGVFSITVMSRAGSMRVEIAHITSFQSRASMSSSTTITHLVYMNWRR